MKILHVTPTFYPATFYGGPIYSTYGLCNALARQPGVELTVLTTDAAGPRLPQRVIVDTFPAAYPGGYKVYFTRRLLAPEFAPGLLARLGPMVQRADIVHLTGTYSLPTIPTLLAARFLHRPVLWSPRGALLASRTWAEASRPNIKRLWERACRIVMRDCTILHVTSNEERAASVARLPGAEAVVIPNGIDLPLPISDREWRPSGTLRLMFLGRLDPVKALDRLIEAVARLAPNAPQLDLYGVGEGAYVESLRRLAVDRDAGDLVRFHGQTEGEAKRRAFSRADICVLPSHSENFGMVVAEALAHGVPVVASKGVPWAEVESRGCGRWVENTPEALASAIRSLSNRDLAAMGYIGRLWMESEFGWESLAARTLQVMTDMVRGDDVACRLGTP